MMEFLPQPKKLSKAEGVFRLGLTTPIVLAALPQSCLLYAKLLQKEIQEATGLCLEITAGKSKEGAVVLALDSGVEKGHYILSVAPSQVLISSADDEGLLHGAMTLCQWIRRHGAILPCLSIEDWPDLYNRGYYLDCSRGRVPTLEMLKKYADLLVRYKINQWQLYIEHTYLFEGLSEAWRHDTPLTAQEIMELDRYCNERHIELVPSLSTFGHMYEILSTKTMSDYCELENSESQPFGYIATEWHHTLNVAHPNALPWILSLIDEYQALFTSKKFNICCDETFDLGTGRSKQLVEEKGKETVYVEHVAALCNHLLSKGIQPQFWGDIIWRHPETYERIPKGTVCLNWGYRPDQPEDEIRALAEVGATQYTCSGVCAWKYLIPLYETAFLNNRAMSSHARKYKAIGQLNTDWGDWGHMSHPTLAIPGIIYGATFAWNADNVDFDAMNQAIGLLEFGDRSGQLLEGMNILSNAQTMCWGHLVLAIEEEALFEKRKGEISMEALLKSEENINKALQLIDSAAPQMPAKEKEIISALHIAALGTRLFNRYGLWRLGDRQVTNQSIQLAGEIENWYRLHQNQRKTVAKEGPSYRSLHIICRVADQLRGRNISSYNFVK